MKVWYTLGSLASIASLVQHSSAQKWPLHDNGLNQVVEWYDPQEPRFCGYLSLGLQDDRDHYSVKVNGERLFLWSGEVSGTQLHIYVPTNAQE